MNPDPDEEAEKNKVEDLRGRLKKEKEAHDTIDDDVSGSEISNRSSGGILAPLCLTALLGVGGFIAWQFMQLNNNFTGGLPSMNASFPAGLNQSYEYAVDFIFDSNLSGRMAQRGKEGWQVVGSRRTQDSITGQLGYEFIFMRKTK